ncbi:hypothetical protein H0H93_011666 [Arthromyces matolae]|nr:hypothetical protein H0H93_011666 [Arthromyces matolae]
MSEANDIITPMLCLGRRTGTPRKPQETIESIKSQVRLACGGQKDAVESAVTQTGVKDKIAQYWINQILPKAQEEIKLRTSPSEPTCDRRLLNKTLKGDARKAVKDGIIHDVQNEMWNWIISQPASSYQELAEHDPRRRDLRPGDHYNILLALEGINPHTDTAVEILHTWLLGQEKYVWHDTSKDWDGKAENTFAIRLQSSSVDGLTIPPPRAAYLVRYKNSLIGKHFKVLEQLGIFHIHGLCSNLLFDLWKASGELGAYLWFPEIKDLNTYLADLQILIDNVLDIWALIDPMRILVKVKLHMLPHLVDDIRRFGPAILFSTEAPSHDIATTLGDMERFKHQVSGGWWKGANGKYIQAGKSIRNFLRGNKELQRRLGWVDTANIQAVSRSHDVCKPGSWVFVFHDGSTRIGKITGIFALHGSQTVCTNPERAVVVLDEFKVHGKNTRLNMPILRCAGVTLVASPKHDCVTSSCVAANSNSPQVQERIQTTVHALTIAHEKSDLYLINMHAFHNAHLIRASLPRDLTEPTPYLADRMTSRKKIAAQLRVIGPAKRAETEKKRADTRARNVRAAADRQAETAAREDLAG